MVIKEHLKTRFSNLEFEFRRNLKKKKRLCRRQVFRVHGKDLMGLKIIRRGLKIKLRD